MLSDADRRSIADLVRLADDTATRRDNIGYADLYTEDGIMEGTQGRAEGRAAVAATVKAVWAREPAGSRHVTRDIEIAEEVGDIIARSLLVILAPGAAAPFAQASVKQTIRRTSEGWRIARRLIDRVAVGP